MICCGSIFPIDKVYVNRIIRREVFVNCGLLSKGRMETTFSK